MNQKSPFPQTSAGMNLLKQSKKSLFRAVFSRTGLISCLLLINAGLLAVLFWRFSEFIPHYLSSNAVITVVMVLTILNSRHDPTSKITWLVIIMCSPLVGSALYLYIRSDVGHRALKKRIRDLMLTTRDLLPQDPAAAAAFEETAPGAAGLARYLRRTDYFSTCAGTDAVYFPQGEDKFRRLLLELEQAREFIFLEYFIVEEGVMWGRILEILARKAAQGVDVRVMYDGFCEFVLLPRDYPRMLNQLGISCKVFAPVMPFVSTHYNYRDHRKIAVIDGHTAFTGGVNLADEYINVKPRFGHWKDTALMVKGEAARGFTLMFLQMWNLGEKHPDFDRFLTRPLPPAQGNGGFCIPYWDCPLDDRRVGQQVYMDILNRARRYVHIMTPYLILDGEMENALKYAAERGVDVRLILPGIPDKKMPYALAKTHYPSLMASGVRIYEYTPGFVHAKSFVCDDREAVVGTINLDYRSLYHHFECAAYLHGADCIAAIEEDFQTTQNQCRRVTRETLRAEKWTIKLMGCLLKIVAPLL